MIVLSLSREETSVVFLRYGDLNETTHYLSFDQTPNGTGETF
jgi:hypothetical protein